jgi:hypothetical protein
MTVQSVSSHILYAFSVKRLPRSVLLAQSHTHTGLNTPTKLSACTGP